MIIRKERHAARVGRKPAGSMRMFASVANRTNLQQQHTFYVMPPRVATKTININVACHRPISYCTRQSHTMKWQQQQQQRLQMLQAPAAVLHQCLTISYTPSRDARARASRIACGANVCKMICVMHACARVVRTTD